MSRPKNNQNIPFAGLSLRLVNVLGRLGLKSKQEVKEAIIYGTLSWHNTRGLGATSYKELMEWTGLNPGDFPPPAKKPHRFQENRVHHWKKLKPLFKQSDFLP